MKKKINLGAPFDDMKKGRKSLQGPAVSSHLGRTGSVSCLTRTTGILALLTFGENKGKATDCGLIAVLKNEPPSTHDTPLCHKKSHMRNEKRPKRQHIYTHHTMLLFSARFVVIFSFPPPTRSNEM